MKPSPSMPPLRVGYQFPQPEWLHDVTVTCKDFKSMSGCTGAIAEVFYFLQDAMGVSNLTMISATTGAGWGQLLPNGTWTGVTGDMLKNISDVTVASWHPQRCLVVDCLDLGLMQRFFIAAPQPKIKSFIIALIQPFALSVWYTIFAAFIVLVIIGKLMPKTFNNLMEWAILLFTLLVYQDAPKSSLHHAANAGPWRNLRFKTVLGVWLVATFFIGNLYSARLVDHLVNPFEKPLRGVGDILASGLPIEVSPGEIALHDNLRNSKNPALREVGKVMKIIDYQTWWNYEFSEKIFIDAWLVASSRLKFVMRDQPTRAWGKIRIVSDRELPVQRFVLYLRKDMKENVKNAVGHAITKIVEGGFMTVWLEKNLKTVESRLQTVDGLTEEQLLPISIQNLKGIFILWGGALAFTCVIFAVEVVVGKRKRHRQGI